jgi:ATP-dependent DNA helicase RecQ
LQREIIESVLSGSPTLAILPTGGGKSFTYQLPALVLDGVCVVISPLLSLIEDQTQELERKGIPVARYDSTLCFHEKRETLKRLDEGEVEIFYTSPESLSNPELLKSLKTLSISLVAIDEAHCISEWGHSFRPSYLYLPKLVRSLKPRATLALTATATRKTASSIRKLFKIKTAQQFQSSHFRENLHFNVIPVLPKEKDTELLKQVENSEQLPAIVYVMRQEDCEKVAAMLSAHGHKARSYHAGLSNTSRIAIQSAFLSDEIDIIVATIAFGMGVDKPNIRSVIHYHLPKSPEGWMQESGRAGRDGDKSQCTLLASGDDIIPLENFAYAKEMEVDTLTGFLTSLRSQGNRIQLSPYQTRLQYDFMSSTFDVLMAKLEVSGHLKFISSEWRYIRAWPVAGKQLDLTGFTKKQQRALDAIFQMRDRYDTHQSQEDFQLSPKLLWKALIELRDSDDIVYKPSGWLWNYQSKKPLDESTIDALTSEASQQLETTLTKAHTVTKIATSKTCIPLALSKWFGETLNQPCGHCSACLGKHTKRKLPTSSAKEPTDTELHSIKELLRTNSRRLTSIQLLTRFLCGIPSQAIRHYYLHQKAEFGLLKHLPFETVRAYATVLLNGN